MRFHSSSSVDSHIITTQINILFFNINIHALLDNIHLYHHLHLQIISLLRPDLSLPHILTMCCRPTPQAVQQRAGF